MVFRKSVIAVPVVGRSLLVYKLARLDKTIYATYMHEKYNMEYMHGTHRRAGGVGRPI